MREWVVGMLSRGFSFLLIGGLFLIVMTVSSSCLASSDAETTGPERGRPAYPPHLFYDNKDNPYIAVIGGGYTGVLSSLLLAGLKKPGPDGQPALSVHLFEQDLNLMNGASLIPARLHLGGEYPKDPPTAFQCLISALIFRQMFPTESILTDRKRIDFLLAGTNPDGLT